MLGIDLEHARRPRIDLIMRLHEPFQMHVHVTIVSNQTNRAIGQTRRGPNIFHLIF